MDPIYQTLWLAFAAGLLAALACGLGVLPLFVRGIDPARHRGIGYAVAGGLMFSASVYNLILPGMGMDGGGEWTLRGVTPVIAGILLGAAFLALTAKLIHHDQAHDDLDDALAKPGTPVRAKGWGGTVGLLVFIAMTVHSIPEGDAVGVGYTADAAGRSPTGHMGPTLALAIALHNTPEGLAVAIPLRSAGVSIRRCFWAAVITSLPQPIAAVPAVLLAWFFQPLMPLLMGFAAGAMIFLVVLELIPEALECESPSKTAWAFTLGFCGMLLVQVLLRFDCRLRQRQSVENTHADAEESATKHLVLEPHAHKKHAARAACRGVYSLGRGRFRYSRSSTSASTALSIRSGVS